MTMHGLKVAEFRTASLDIDKISIVYAEDPGAGTFGRKAYRLFLRPKKGLLKYYWRHVYYSDEITERAF